MKYYTLIGRRSPERPYEIIYSHYNRLIVADRLRDAVAAGRWITLHIAESVKTQAESDRTVQSLNAQLATLKTEVKS